MTAVTPAEAFPGERPVTPAVVAEHKLNDIEYFYESQLATETAPVADKHLHPAEPRTLRLALRIAF